MKWRNASYMAKTEFKIESLKAVLIPVAVAVREGAISQSGGSQVGLDVKYGFADRRTTFGDWDKLSGY